MAPPTPWSRFLRRVREQDGVVSLEQALAAGLSHESVQRRVASGRWFRVGPRVYQLADHHETPRSRMFAVMLSLGSDATLVGRSAAWWWGLTATAPARVEVAVAPPRQPRARAGAVVRRRAVDPVDRTVVRGVAVTKRAPTVLDAAARLGLLDGAQLMDRALQDGRVSPEGLRAVHLRTSGRHGAALASELLALAGGGARSEAERVCHRVLRAAGVYGWTANTTIGLPGGGRAVGDLVFAEEKVVVEIDGWAYHRDLAAFLRDGPRQSALAADGWVVLRTHWHELRADPEVFLGHLRRARWARSGR